MLFGMFLVGSGNAFAAERVWTGAGSDSNFSTAENWEGDTAPVDGDSLQFPVDTILTGCSADVELVNDLDAETVTIAGIDFPGSAPSGCYHQVVISGSDLALAGDITQESYNVTDILSTIVLGGDSAISKTRINAIDIGAYNLETDGTALILGAVSGSGTITVLTTAASGAGGGGGCGDGESGSYPVNVDSPDFSGDIVLDGPGSYWVVSAREDDIARNAGHITVRNDARITFGTNYQEDMTFATPMAIEGRVTSYQMSKYVEPDCLTPTTRTTVTITSIIEISGAVTVTPSRTDIIFAGAVVGANNIQITPGVDGSVTVNGTQQESELNTMEISDESNSEYCYESTYGLSVLTNNKYIWNIDCPQMGTVDSGSIRGILAGVGRIGNVTIEDGGVIAPGNSPGTLSTGNLTFEEGGIYEFELAGAEAGQYDQINVTGTVTLGNGTLSVLPLEGFVPTQGQSFVIINNDGTDAVDGVFAGLAEGATVEVDGQPWFTISYIGGDGNDVVLTTIPGVGDAGNRENLPVATYALGGVMALGLGAIIRRKMLPIKNRR